VLGAQEQVLHAFDQHLEKVAGLAPTTRSRYGLLTRSFLTAVFGDREPDWAQLRPEQVVGFVQQRAEKRALTCRKDPGAVVRVFLRYLAGQNLVSPGLEYAIPGVRQWKHAALPRFLRPEELARVLALPWERTSKGLRDRAILLLLARLGLRPGEIVRLQLDDIDWRTGNLRIRAGKTHRERLLPLPQDVGEALTAYLREGRPVSAQRAVFLNLCVPFPPLVRTAVLTKLAREALGRADVIVVHRGAYVFRHTVATNMVCRGVTFKKIADVLGHQSLDSTGVYAKLNLSALAEVALPWPGGAQ
jgi:integrase